MIPYSYLALASVSIFALVHVWAQYCQRLEFGVQGRFLSAGGGVAISYVFIDLLPKLGKSDQIVQQALSSVFPYFERHVYILALAGFLLFFFVDRSQSILGQRARFWLSLASYALFNFLVGYAVTDKNDLEVQPLFLFTFAMALHYFVNDYSLTKEHGESYQHFGKWLLILCLLLGWLTGLWVRLPAAVVALVSAFIGGGVIMNVTRHELPNENPNSLSAFLLCALAYTAILLAIGS